MERVHLSNVVVKDSTIAASVQKRLEVRVIRSVQEIESLRWFWSSSTGLRDSDIDIYLTTQRSGAGDLPPYVIGIYRDQRPESLLIGRVICRRLPLQLGYITLPSPLVRTIVFPYGALRGEDSLENCEILIRQVIRSLKDREADLAVFEHIKLGSFLWQCANRGAGLLLRDRFAPVRPHFKREVPNNLEELQASLSSSERKRFRQIAKKLETTFPEQIKLIVLGQPRELETIIRDVEEVAKKTWQRELGLGGFNTTSALREKLMAEAKRGWLRVYVLYLAEKPIAFWAGAVYQETFYSDFTGYDPEFGRYSLGTYLLSRIFEDLCLNGVRSIDFGFSDEEYKRRFGNVMWQETTLHLFPSSLKGLTLSILRGSVALISNLARTILLRTGLMQRVKKHWRN